MRNPFKSETAPAAQLSPATDWVTILDLCDQQVQQANTRLGELETERVSLALPAATGDVRAHKRLGEISSETEAIDRQLDSLEIASHQARQKLAEERSRERREEAQKKAVTVVELAKQRLQSDQRLDQMLSEISDELERRQRLGSNLTAALGRSIPRVFDPTVLRRAIKFSGLDLNFFQPTGAQAESLSSIEMSGFLGELMQAEKVVAILIGEQPAAPEPVEEAVVA